MCVFMSEHMFDHWRRDSCFFFSSRRRHTRLQGDWSSDVCSSDLQQMLNLLPLPNGYYDPANNQYNAFNYGVDTYPYHSRKIGRASCRERCRCRWSTCDEKKNKSK